MIDNILLIAIGLIIAGVIAALATKNKKTRKLIILFIFLVVALVLVGFFFIMFQLADEWGKTTI